jgi:hypothetical protein
VYVHEKKTLGIALTVIILFYATLPYLRKSIAVWKVPTIHPSVFMEKQYVVEVSAQHWWRIDRRNRKKTLSLCYSVHHLTWTDLEPNPVPRGESPATNSLNPLITKINFKQ